MNQLPQITIIGADSQAGSYLLRIQVTTPLKLSFGRFRKGKRIVVPAGTYVYIGSALGQKGATSLGRRLVRHATRSTPKPPHDIRSHLLDHFQILGLGQGDLRPQRDKTLYWNVDHLLDRVNVHLTHVIAMRSPERIEAQLGQFLMQDSTTHIVEAGLGANDIPGNTHLLGVNADEAWWLQLPDRLTVQFLMPDQDFIA